MATGNVTGAQKADILRAAADAVASALYALADDAEGRLPEHLTIKEVAGILRVTPDTVWRMTKDGRLPSRKIGHKVLIPADAVRELTP